MRQRARAAANAGRGPELVSARLPRHRLSRLIPIGVPRSWPLPTARQVWQRFSAPRRRGRGVGAKASGPALFAQTVDRACALAAGPAPFAQTVDRACAVAPSLCWTGSVGSLKHPELCSRPFVNAAFNGFCAKGPTCEYCHVPHEDRRIKFDKGAPVDRWHATRGLVGKPHPNRAGEGAQCGHVRKDSDAFR